MYETLAILAAFVFLYSLTSGGLEKTPVNGAIGLSHSVWRSAPSAWGF
jgi:hypothetical protein